MNRSVQWSWVSVTRAWLILVAVAALTVSLPGPALAAAAAPKLAGARCVPATLAICREGVRVIPGQPIALRGKRLRRGLEVEFRTSGRRRTARLAKTLSGWTVAVPLRARRGAVRVTVTDRGGRRSNALRIRVVAATAPLPPAAGAAPGGIAREVPAVFRATGSWIWVLGDAEGGTPDALAARAGATATKTLFVKSADGRDRDPQFTPELVAALKARGLQVCGWQAVYGRDPAGEAAAAVASIAAGADCFVINAEDQYGGRYAQARQYVAALRGAAGPSYPIGFTSHAYADAHAAVPYSVFLGPGGAQANLPQVYWKELGAAVDTVTARTIVTNRIFGVPQVPIGQAWDDPAAADVRRFRAIWTGHGAPGLSWWRAELATPVTWSLVGEAPPPATVLPDPGWPELAAPASGDLVVRLQQHLAREQPALVVDGQFGPATTAALAAFQADRRLPRTARADAATWRALLLTEPRVS